jgi:hypothetical protein
MELVEPRKSQMYEGQPGGREKRREDREDTRGWFDIRRGTVRVLSKSLKDEAIHVSVIKKS